MQINEASYSSTTIPKNQAFNISKITYLNNFSFNYVFFKCKSNLSWLKYESLLNRFSFNWSYMKILWILVLSNYKLYQTLYGYLLLFQHASGFNIEFLIYQMLSIREKKVGNQIAMERERTVGETIQI